MSNNPDLAAEQKFLAHAYDRLESMRRAAQEMMESVLSTPKGGTHQARAERDVVVRQSLNRLERLEIGDQALCFGGIDYSGSLAEVSEFHIGRVAVSDDDMEPLVVDWRAPVAEPFYRATGKNPMELSRRRHFAVEHRQVVSIEDEYFNSGDLSAMPEGDDLQLMGPGALFAAVTRARTGRMADIVATIQSQQDQIIRAPLSETLVVQGGPGTGKTAVALHRAAYLLYTHRMRLELQGVLVVAPNRTFARYIDNVLPSLGETGVEILTVEGLAGFGEAKLQEDPEKELVKGDLRMAAFIAKAVRDRQRPLKEDQYLAIGAFMVQISVKDSVEAVRIARRRSGSHNQRRKFVESFLAVRLVEKYLSKRELRVKDDLVVSDIVVPELELAPGGDDENDIRRDIAIRVRKSAQFQAVIQRIWPKLTPETFLSDLFSHMPLIRLAGREIFTETELQHLYRSHNRDESRFSWSRSDVVLLNEARTLIGNYSSKGKSADEERGYGHIIVDEAQDLTPMAARMIGRYSLSGSMTLVGDTAQSTSPFGPRSWDEVIAPLPKAKSTSVVQLNVNYRTPEEVMNIAGQVMKRFAPELELATSIRKSGEPVILIKTHPSEFDQALISTVGSEMEKVDLGTVGVIVPRDSVDSFKTKLNNAGIEVGLSLVSPVSVLAIDEAKGLEFDSVIISGADRLVGNSAENLQALYVAMTRTTKRLIILDNKDTPDFVVNLVSGHN